MRKLGLVGGVFMAMGDQSSSKSRGRGYAFERECRRELELTGAMGTGAEMAKAVIE